MGDGGGVLLADAAARWGGGGGGRGERDGGEGLGRPAWVKGTTIWPPPSPATTRWSWLGSELAGRQRRPKRSRLAPAARSPTNPQEHHILALGQPRTIAERVRRAGKWGYSVEKTEGGSVWATGQPVFARRANQYPALCRYWLDWLAENAFRHSPAFDSPTGSVVSTVLGVFRYVTFDSGLRYIY